MAKTSTYSKTIPELISQSKYEPSLKTVLVEGDEDKRVYEHLFRDACGYETNFLPIRFVEVPLPETLGKGIGGGNRARIIQAGASFSKANTDPNTLFAIADTDLGFVIPCGPRYPEQLEYTQATCLETFFWSEKIITRFLTAYCGVESITAKELLKTLDSPLRKMFLMRAAITSLGLSLGWIENPDFELKSDRTIEFDSDKYLIKLLNKTNNFQFHSEVVNEFTKLEVKSASLPPARTIHGHDFISFLRAYLRKVGVSSKILPKETTFRTLALCGEIEDLAENGFLQRIRSRFVTGSGNIAITGSGDIS